MDVASIIRMMCNLSVLALPYPAKRLDVKYKMECFGGDKDNFYVQYESKGEELWQSAYWPDGTLMTAQLQELSSLTFVVTLQIISTSNELF